MHAGFAEIEYNTVSRRFMYTTYNTPVKFEFDIILYECRNNVNASIHTHKILNTPYTDNHGNKLAEFQIH